MKIFVLPLFYFFSAGALWAQSLDFHDFTNPCKQGMIETSALRLLSKPKNTDDFSQERQQVSIRKTIDKDCRWTPSLSFERNDFDGIGLTQKRSTFLNTRLGVSYRQIQADRKFYQIQIGGAYRGEAQSGAHVFLPTGFALWSHKSTGSRWFYGGGVSDIFGNIAAFPIFGVHKRWNRKWSTRFLVPLIFNSTYRYSREEAFSLIASPMSFQSELANDGRFNSTKSTLQGRFRAFRIGIGLRKKLRHKISIRAQVGLLLGRRYQIYDNNSRVYEERVKGTPFGELGVSWHF